jgi:hypothetical protein
MWPISSHFVCCVRQLLSTKKFPVSFKIFVINYRCFEGLKKSRISVALFILQYTQHPLTEAQLTIDWIILVGGHTDAVSNLFHTLICPSVRLLIGTIYD